MNKKILLLIVLFAGVFTLVGCGGKKASQKTLSCTLEQDVTSDVKLVSSYNVRYTGKYVDKITTTETVTTNSSAILDAYKTQLDNVYSKYRALDGYDNTIKTENNKLISTTDIDYTKIDVNKLIEIDSSISSIIENGKLKLSDIKSAYESLGATCK